MNMRVEREFELIYFEVKILDLHTPLAYRNTYKGIICKNVVSTSISIHLFIV